MQFIVEVLAAIVVWAAGLAFSQFGIELDLARPAATPERVIQRTPPPEAESAVAQCPDQKPTLRRV